MSLHPEFSTSPYAPLIPEQRWFPADGTLRSTAYEKLLPPLAAKVRQEVHAWRGKGYPGASPTSVALLQSWFETEHLLENADGSLSPFRYYFAQLDYVKADGDLSNDTPDFIVRTTEEAEGNRGGRQGGRADGTVWIVETKSREEIDLPQKMARLQQWCADATAAEENGTRYDFVFVDQKGFEKHPPETFASLTASFAGYKQQP